jgi:hypothetical protein
MSDALYLNGVYRTVLEEIVRVQSAVPDQPLFLQPYSESQIKMLAEHPPTADNPVRVFVSTTDDLAHVIYAAEIIDWHDKRGMPAAVRHIFDKLIDTFQRGETKIYDRGVNVLVVRRMIELETPIPVGNLIVVSTNAPHGVRGTAGHWSIVRPDPVGFSASALRPSGARGTFTEIPKAE